MGCISSKSARAVDSPNPYGVVSSSASSNGKRRGGRGRGRSVSSSDPFRGKTTSFGALEKITEEPEREGIDEEREEENIRTLKRGSSLSSRRRRAFSFKLGRLTEGELVAAGWPAWISSVAGEAIDGWLPLRADSFERLEKVGQGTYSDVFRARELETGRIMAVKKVRFDSSQPESVRFMAREITILRQLSHPNVMKLEGIITSPLSNHLYLVFEYMEHDLAGLLASPDIRFTEAQIKCYMRQILSGVEHCHSQGILHRDIKTSNILVNNQGILKLADFGLANFMRPKNKQPLTSRVVTLWYRAPELLLGSTEYGEAVDLWSVGCVSAELFTGRPILKGRTEVEQLHKIFRLCGSPPEDYWKTSKLPLANIFKPQHPYESTLHKRCKELPKGAVNLIATFLSIEPYKRGSASTALNSEYFNTRPYACDPSSLPKYTPSKEIDAKLRYEARRRAGGITQLQTNPRNSRRFQKPLQESADFSKAAPTEVAEGSQAAERSQGDSVKVYYKRRGSFMSQTTKKQPYDAMPEASQESQGSQAFMQSSESYGNVWNAGEKQGQPSSRNQRYISEEPPRLLQVNDALDLDEQQNNDSSSDRIVPAANKAAQPDCGDSFNLDTPHELYLDGGNKKKGCRVAFSGPVIYHYEEVTSNEHDDPVNPHRQPHQRLCFYKDL